MTTRTQRYAIGAVLAGLIVVFAFARCGGNDTTEQPSEPAAQATTASAAPPDALPSTVPTAAPTATATGQPQYLVDDIYEVGREIQAGTYVTVAPDDHACYWARLRSFGRPDSIIDDRNLNPGESARVAVKPTDAGFKVANGCRWERAPLS